MTDSNETIDDPTGDDPTGAPELDVANETAEQPPEHSIADPAQRPAEAIDLDAIAKDLDDVQTALDRLNDGTYWTDEVTGASIPDEVLAERPTARSATRSATDR